MSEPSNGAWPFQEIPEEEGLDISAIFGDSSAAPQGDPFAPPAAAQSVPSSPTPVAQEITPAVAATSQPTTAPIAKAPVEAPAENPIAAAFEQKTAENTKKGLLEKPPVFYHKGVKEEIDDPSMTFEELRIRKSDDFTDLEEGKRVSWSVEYCGIRKEVKDPKGTTIISMKEMIERSREFLDALKKTKDKAPCCYVKPKVEMKTKGNAAYKGKFGTLEEARNSDKVICLIPSNDGRIYELRKMEQGEFIAPKKNVVDFSEVRAGFSPALPKIPAELMGQIIAFFRAFMTDHGENEAFAQIYWDKAEKRFFAYVPKQSVCKEEVEADLHDCLYDDEERYLCYADMLDRPARFVVCDGDIVEPKNLDRQNFVPADLGENKARVLAERYSTVLGMETEYVPNFIEKLPDLMELIEPKEWELNPYSTKRTKEMVLLLGCVDNNKTRQLCHQAFHQSEELIYIDSGNGKYTGQVVCGVRRNGRTIRKSIGGVHPEMLKDTDLFPSEISCAEAAQEDPQSIVANVTAATAVLIMVYNILTHGENNAMQTDFSTQTIRMQTVLEKQTRRRAA